MTGNRAAAAGVCPAIGVVLLMAGPVLAAAPASDASTHATPRPPSGQSGVDFSIGLPGTAGAVDENGAHRERDASGRPGSVYLPPPEFDGCERPEPLDVDAAERGLHDGASDSIRSGLPAIPVGEGATSLGPSDDRHPVPGGSGSAPPAAAPVGSTPGKISRNVYRAPYAGNSGFRMIVDYVDHGGSMDSRATSRVCTNDVSVSCPFGIECFNLGGSCDYVLVAPADGIVCTVIEHFDDCGGTVGTFGPFGNSITILHANGEASRHLHLKQWSCSLFGITPGMFVSQGQPIGIEGDVGRTAGGDDTDCGTDGPPRVGTCFESVPTGATNCFRHDHWNIIRYTTGEVLQPFTCGIPSNIYNSSTSYTASDCGTSGSYPTNASDSSSVYNGFGTFKVIQAHNTITASTVTVQNQASVVYHAGGRVRLLPGFNARAGGYFRAESAPPDITAASTWDPPSNCPCSGVVGFCYQWSDPSNPDGTSHGCNPPGPASNSCHGCSIGGRCCPCVGNGTCQVQGSCP